MDGLDALVLELKRGARAPLCAAPVFLTEGGRAPSKSLCLNGKAVVDLDGLEGNVLVYEIRHGEGPGVSLLAIADASPEKPMPVYSGGFLNPRQLDAGRLSVYYGRKPTVEVQGSVKLEALDVITYYLINNGDAPEKSLIINAVNATGGVRCLMDLPSEPRDGNYPRVTLTAPSDRFGGTVPLEKLPVRGKG